MNDDDQPAVAPAGGSRHPRGRVNFRAALADAFGIAVDIADRAIELGECDCETVCRALICVHLFRLARPRPRRNGREWRMGQVYVIQTSF